jgi:lipoprotein-anchoring transpeptidase ErfK/SrfK
MTDYYPVLLRAVTAPGAGDAQWRRAIYDHARQVIVKEMRARRPPARLADIAAEQVALEAAIKRVEADMLLIDGPARPSRPAAIAPSPQPAGTDTRGNPADEQSFKILQTFNILKSSKIFKQWPINLQRNPNASPFQLIGPSLFVLPAIVVVLAVGAYAYWAISSYMSAPPTGEASASRTAPAAVRATTVAVTKDGDLPPGIDGGSSDTDLSYVFRRQPTFYRTLQPVGTIIVDKLQHFLYLIQPNNVALRYGIGLGEQCTDLAGLRRISSMTEWPPWQAPADMVKRKLASAGTLPGGPGNPLGARLLELDDGSSRIHGTNAPKTIGSSVAFGCIRLINDDIVDLYNRVKVSTPVVVN